MFTRLDATIYKHLLPLLKPLSLACGDEVYRRGQESANLCFLVKGELEMLSAVDDESVEIRLTPERLTIYDNSGKEILVLNDDEDHSDGVQGCFGHSVMKGERRRNNCRASATISECLTIDKADLVDLFDVDPANVMRLCKIVLLAYKRVDALLKIMAIVRLNSMPDLNAKLVGKIQSTFRSYMVSSKTCKYDALYMKIHEDDAEPEASGGAVGGAPGEAPAGRAEITKLTKGLAALDTKVATMQTEMRDQFELLSAKLTLLLDKKPGGSATPPGSAVLSALRQGIASQR